MSCYKLRKEMKVCTILMNILFKHVVFHHPLPTALMKLSVLFGSCI